MSRTVRVMFGAVLALALAGALMGGWGQDASAGRPSLQNLQVQINQLNARINQLEGQVDTLEDLVDTLAPFLSVSDGAGADLGLLVDWGLPGAKGATITYLPSINALIYIARQNFKIPSPSDVHFSQPGCQGDAFIKDGNAGFLIPAGAPDRFFVARPAVAVSTTYSSYLTDTNCIETAGQWDLIPAEEISQPLGFTSQLVEPLSFHQLTSP